MPSTFRSPPSGRIKPAARRISVVFPAPSGPTSAVNAPCATSIETPFSASTLSPLSRRNVLRTFRPIRTLRLSLSFIATLGLTFLQLQVNASRHSQSKFIRRIFDKHANFIDEAGPELLGLHRFWREFSDRRNESDPTVETATGKAIDDNSRGHAGFDFSKIRLRDEGADPLGIGNRQRKHRALRRGHLSRFHHSGAYHRVHRRDQLRVFQLLAQHARLRLECF